VIVGGVSLTVLLAKEIVQRETVVLPDSLAQIIE
jgi:hypothetical protein